MVGKDDMSSAEAIAKSVEKVSDSKGLAAIGTGLGWGIAAIAFALMFWATNTGSKWDGRLFPEQRCYQLEAKAGRVFKVNACTGEVVELPSVISEPASD